MRAARDIRGRLYDSQYFERELAHSLDSARVVTPIVAELVSPLSVVDIGCGTGAWLLAFRENGVRDVRGYDGAHVEDAQLLIPREFLHVVDLEDPMLSIEGKFDLAVSLEVAEHLTPKAGGKLVQLLTQVAPVVLFSAAVPRQGGTGHINEQWPEYWAALFREREFFVLDPIRPKIFFDSRVQWVYRQNILMFVSAAHPRSDALIATNTLEGASGTIEWVNHRIARRPPTLRETLLNIVPAMRRSLSYHGRRLL